MLYGPEHRPMHVHGLHRFLYTPKHGRGSSVLQNNFNFMCVGGGVCVCVCVGGGGGVKLNR